MHQPPGNKRTIKYSFLRYKANAHIWVSSSGSMASRPDYFEKLDSLEIANYTKSKLNYFPSISTHPYSVTKFDDNTVASAMFYNSVTCKQINATLHPDFSQA